jgi:hypothetical protein
MTNEEIKARIKTLEDEKKSLLATYEGAIQDCNYWLAQAEKPAEEVKEEVDV